MRGVSTVGAAGEGTGGSETRSKGKGIRGLAGPLLLAILLAMATCSLDDALAQGSTRDGALGVPMRVQAPMPRPEAELTAPSVLVAAPASEVVLGVRIADGGTAPANSFVRIRGLPPTAALTDGHAIAPGAWAVPISALNGLKVILPAGLSGKRDIPIALVTADGRVVHETKFALVIGAAGLIAPEAGPPQATAMPPPPAQSPVLEPPAPAAPPPPQLIAPPVPVERPAPPPPQVAAPVPVPLPPQTAAPPKPAQPASTEPSAPAAVQPPATARPKSPPAPNPEAAKRAQTYVSRGQTHLKDGDIASARLFLQRAAEDGLAEAALVMGGTFDPNEIAKMRAVSIKPDLAEARRWYERAAELGSGEAIDRLKRLGAR